MRQSTPTIVYFENLTLMNFSSALLMYIKGHQICYFALGRVFRKFPILGPILVRRFTLANIWISEFPGLGFSIHQAALDAAEEIHQRTARENPSVFRIWGNTFRSEKINLFIKKAIATESWNLIKIYMILSSRVEAGHPPVRLVVLDKAINRVVMPWLRQEFPEPRVQVNRFGHPIWYWIQGTFGILYSTAWELGGVLGQIRRGGLRLRSRKRYFKVSKEMLWGVGTGTPRRHDDFIVDGETISPENILLYHRRGTTLRTNALPSSIKNAKAKGYSCINFDRAPISLNTLWAVLAPRYILFPLVVCFISLTKLFINPSAWYLNSKVMGFLGHCAKWEVFLASYSPALNLSQDEWDPGHIADTIALNLHGSLNAGFQWADMTQWKAVTLSYLGYDIYFAWGALAEKYWEGNWCVDQVVHTGYLWGNHYRLSLEQRNQQRKRLSSGDPKISHVVALLDEKPGPDIYTSEKMLYDFYRIGVELLNKRPDTTVIAKPKNSDGVRDKPYVQNLIEPYVKSGRFHIWDQMTSDVPNVIAVSDLVVSMVMGSPYLEAVCCQKTGFNYAPIANHSSWVYQQGSGKIIFEDVDTLLGAINSALDHPDEDTWAGLENLRDDLDPFRDFNGIYRLRDFINSIPESNTAGFAVK